MSRKGPNKRKSAQTKAKIALAQPTVPSRGGAKTVARIVVKIVAITVGAIGLLAGLLAIATEFDNSDAQFFAPQAPSATLFASPFLIRNPSHYFVMAPVSFGCNFEMKTTAAGGLANAGVVAFFGAIPKGDQVTYKCPLGQGGPNDPPSVMVYPPDTVWASGHVQIVMEYFEQLWLFGEPISVFGRQIGWSKKQLSNEFYFTRGVEGYRWTEGRPID